MQDIPVFDEFGFRPSVPFKIPMGVWVFLAFALGAIFALIFFSPKEEKVIRIQEPEPNKKIA